jgi:sirohydrochlorin ferrochelatase
MKTAVMLMAHGSRIPEANDAVREIAAMVKEMTEIEIVEVSFREQHPPDIQQGIDTCVAKGAERIILIPYFLYMGAHVREDLPREMEEARGRYPHVAFVMGSHLGAHRKLAEIVVERITQAAGGHLCL